MVRKEVWRYVRYFEKNPSTLKNHPVVMYRHSKFTLGIKNLKYQQ
jgi:hypothetical protein